MRERSSDPTRQTAGGVRGGGREPGPQRRGAPRSGSSRDRATPRRSRPLKKPAAVALLSSFVVSTDASGFRDLVEKVVGRRSGSDADKIAIAAAVAQGSDAAVVEGESNRELATQKWHLKYSAGWTGGYCQLIVDLNSPGYSTELACCKEAYAGQIGGSCLGSLPSPPTTSPTDTGGLDFYYPDYAKGRDEAYCINTRPMPNGRPTYKTMILCCKGAYAGQFSGECRFANGGGSWPFRGCRVGAVLDFDPAAPLSWVVLLPILTILFFAANFDHFICYSILNF